MREHSISLGEALNKAVRRGLALESRPCAMRFVQSTFSLGSATQVRLDKALAIAGAMEDEGLSRKLALSRRTATLPRLSRRTLRT